MEPNPNVKQVPSFFTVQEAAAILRLSENAIREGIRRGEIPGRKIGRSYRVSARAFEGELPPTMRRADYSTWS